MKELYYTPEIEEFHVGFEYEREEPYLGTFDKCVYAGEMSSKHFEKYSEEFRVKYLDREDIESLGFGNFQKSIMHWYSIKGSFRTPGDRNKVSEYKLRHDPKTHEVHIECYFGGESEGMLFEGFLKNKSELINQLKRCKIEL